MQWLCRQVRTTVQRDRLHFTWSAYSIIAYAHFNNHFFISFFTYFLQYKIGAEV